MKVLFSMFSLLFFLQTSPGEWRKCELPKDGIAVMVSQDFTLDENILPDSKATVRSYSYLETFKGDDVLSYITVLEDEKYKSLRGEDAHEEVLNAALKDLGESSTMEVIYDNFLWHGGYSALEFRMNHRDKGTALKGKFFLRGDRLFLIAMQYVPSIRMNKRSNYFIGSFQFI